jgi:hypothetical protein
MALNDDPEKRRGRPRTSHTDENSVIDKDPIGEDFLQLQMAVVHYY